jgi:hypothetical protein
MRRYANLHYPESYAGRSVPMLDRSRSSGQVNCNFWFLRLWVGSEAITSLLKIIYKYVMNPNLGFWINAFGK